MKCSRSGTISCVTEITAPVRGRPRSAEADQAIADATIALLEEEGYSAMTMQGVAARAGVSTATLYRRWPSKQDLVVATLKSIVINQESIDTGSLAGDLDVFLHLIARKLSSEEGHLYKGIFGEAMLNPALAEALRAGMEGQPFPLVVEMLHRAVERGEIPEPPDPEMAVSLIMGVMHERWLVHDKPVKNKEIRVLVPMLVRALGGRG